MYEHYICEMKAELNSHPDQLGAQRRWNIRHEKHLQVHIPIAYSSYLPIWLPAYKHHDILLVVLVYSISCSHAIKCRFVV